MNAPFSSEQFFGVFARYNTAVWPAQLGLLALALVILAATVWGGRSSARVVYGGLALLWAWCGAVYHLVFFARINPMAYGFAALFLAQGALFGVAAARAGGESMVLGLDGRGIMGAGLLAYALLVYPLLGAALGQVYPAAPSFGLPCPLTIFTFGLLLLAAGRVSIHLLLIPLAWSAVGTMAALGWRVLEDLGLPVAALCGTAIVLIHNGRVRASAPGGTRAGVGETPAPPEGIRRLQ